LTTGGVHTIGENENIVNKCKQQSVLHSIEASNKSTKLVINRFIQLTINPKMSSNYDKPLITSKLFKTIS
jgi:hypothetical protein